MCSLTWHRHSAGYEVFFNRDEKKTRGRATPPAQGNLNGVRHLCPRDADGGGTWLLANEHGLTLALLNYWETDGNTVVNRLSRGRLLTDLLADQKQAADAIALLQKTPLIRYGGFTLVAFDLDQTHAPLVALWNGSKLIHSEAQMPVCSSSYQPNEVIMARQRSFESLTDCELETLWRWHCQEDHPTAYTTRMNRPDAQTWSISHIAVSTQGLHWLYREEKPDLATASTDYRTTLIL